MTKTTNYNLNQWDATDHVTRADFNADNAAIDAALKAVADAARGNCALYFRTRTGTGRAVITTNPVPVGEPAFMIVAHSSGSPAIIGVRGAQHPIYATYNAENYWLAWHDVDFSWVNFESAEKNLSTEGETYYILTLSEIQ